MNQKKNFSSLISLIKTAQGHRSLNQFALHCDISAGHLSRILNGKFQKPPSPQLIQKIANHAYNNITYDCLMEAAGYYITTSTNKSHSVMENYSETYYSTYSEIEMNLIKKIKNNPKRETLLKELLDYPDDKVDQITKIWDIIKKN